MTGLVEEPKEAGGKRRQDTHTGREPHVTQMPKCQWTQKNGDDDEQQPGSKVLLPTSNALATGVESAPSIPPFPQRDFPHHHRDTYTQRENMIENYQKGFGTRGKYVRVKLSIIYRTNRIF